MKLMRLSLCILLLCILISCNKQNIISDCTKSVKVGDSEQKVFKTIGAPDDFLGKNEDVLYYHNDDMDMQLWLENGYVVMKAIYNNQGGFLPKIEISDSYNLISIEDCSMVNFERDMQAVDIIRLFGFNYKIMPPTGNYDSGLQYELTSDDTVFMTFSSNKLEKVVYKDEKDTEKILWSR